MYIYNFWCLSHASIYFDLRGVYNGFKESLTNLHCLSIKFVGPDHITLYYVSAPNFTRIVYFAWIVTVIIISVWAHCGGG